MATVALTESAARWPAANTTPHGTNPASPPIWFAKSAHTRTLSRAIAASVSCE
jgi:hypothetical protein